jgi:hypothetical protein
LEDEMPWLPLSSESPDTSGEAHPALRGATVDKADEPSVPTAAELDTWKWEQHRLETDMAASLGFAVGNVKGSGQGRTVVAEFSRSKTIPVGAGGQARYGVAARLVVNIIGMEAEGNLTLPFVAAQAEFNRVEAYANLTVEGYTGPDVGKLFPKYTAFDVESYVTLMSSLTAMKDTLGKDVDNIKPKQLWVWTPGAGPGELDDQLTRAVGTAWGLTRIKESDTLERAIKRYNDQEDHVARSAIENVYSQLGVDGRDAKPSGEARERAKRLLADYEMHDPLF